LLSLAGGAQISYPERIETARLAVSHVIAKATAIGDRANATNRALPSLFQSEVSVLPGPPTNKIKYLADLLAAVATVIGDTSGRNFDDCVFNRRATQNRRTLRRGFRLSCLVIRNSLNDKGNNLHAEGH
jgi:hypothetical protein